MKILKDRAPFVGCRYHTMIDVNPDTGTIKQNYALDEISSHITCSLDSDGMTLDSIGSELNVSRQRIEQIEKVALDRLNCASEIDLSDISVRSDDDC